MEKNRWAVPNLRVEETTLCFCVFEGADLELSSWEQLVLFSRKGSEQWAMGHPLHARWFVKGKSKMGR